MEQHAISIKKSLSNKLSSSISATRDIREAKKDAAHIQVHSADLFF